MSHIKGWEMFGFDALQQAALEAIGHYLQERHLAGAVAFPTIPYWMFSAFDKYQAEDIISVLKYSWINLPAGASFIPGDLLFRGVSDGGAAALANTAATQADDGWGSGVAYPPVVASKTTVSTFSSGWFHGGTATASTMAASDSEVGTHAEVTTGTTGTGTFSIFNQASVDMTNKHFVIKIKMDDFTAIGGVILRVSSDANVTTNFTDLRVTGGNSVNSIYSIGDGWVEVTFSWADSATTGTVNRAAIKSYQFRMAAFNSLSTKVRFKLLSTVDRVGPFGIIGFDDCQKSALLALPKLQALNFPPVMYAIAERLDDPEFMTMNELIEWETISEGEVAGHCFATAVHDAANGYVSATLADAQADMQKLRAFLFGNNERGYAFKGARHFSWPKGQFNPALEAIAVQLFQTASMATPAFIAQAWPSANPMRCARIPVLATTTPAQIEAEALKAVANGTGAEFMFHKIVESGAVGATEYNLPDFEAAMDLIAATGLPMRTKSQVIDAAY